MGKIRHVYLLGKDLAYPYCTRALNFRSMLHPYATVSCRFLQIYSSQHLSTKEMSINDNVQKRCTKTMIAIRLIYQNNETMTHVLYIIFSILPRMLYKFFIDLEILNNFYTLLSLFISRNFKFIKNLLKTHYLINIIKMIKLK